MRYHDNPVSGNLNIGLDSMTAHIDRSLESTQRVLRIDLVEAAMRHILRQPRLAVVRKEGLSEESFRYHDGQRRNSNTPKKERIIQMLLLYVGSR